MWPTQQSDPHAVDAVGSTHSRFDWTTEVTAPMELPKSARNAVAETTKRMLIFFD